MIVVNGTITTDAATISAVTDIIATMESASRAESGCIDYTFSVELNDPDTMRITEKWQDMDALRAHFAMPHMAEFQQAIGQHAIKGVDVTFYEVKEVDAPRP